MFAFGLLEALTKVGMPFIFKGGSSLMLLTEHPMRPSTDADIIVQPGTDVEHYIEKASEIFPFKAYKEQRRIGKNKIEKRHFKFTYDSPVLKRDFYILLDIVFIDNPYTLLLEKEIQNELLLTEGSPSIVTIPSAECLLGDKMTAFAPHTTGIPLGVDKDLEVMKQMYDISNLFDVVSDYNLLWETYDKVLAEEVAFRGIENDREKVLHDTIEAAVCIIGRGSFNAKEYPYYVQGAQSLESHVLHGRFNGEIAAEHSCKVMYLAASMLKMIPFKTTVEPKDYISVNIGNSEYGKLSFMKKQNLEAYGYLVEAIRLLNN